MSNMILEVNASAQDTSFSYNSLWSFPGTSVLRRERGAIVRKGCVLGRGIFPSHVETTYLFNLIFLDSQYFCTLSDDYFDRCNLLQPSLTSFSDGWCTSSHFDLLSTTSQPVFMSESLNVHLFMKDFWKLSCDKKPISISSPKLPVQNQCRWVRNLMKLSATYIWIRVVSRSHFLPLHYIRKHKLMSLDFCLFGFVSVSINRRLFCKQMLGVLASCFLFESAKSASRCRS